MKNETPILNTLEDYLSKNPIRMHVPFHGGVSNNDILPKELYNLDISEVSGYDTHGEDNPIFQSEKITANFFNVEHSFYLTSGASIGLIASMVALNKFGKKVILARNVHKSIINGVILAGLEPVWLDVEFLDKWGIFSKVDPNKLFEITSKHNDIAGCVIVSPTYEGVISDVELIAQNCHIKNIPLVVDEAHGAHLFFLRTSAISLGADLVIQSWHKSLGSLTQTGVLHLINNNFFSYRDIKRSLELVSSTSPSFILLLSLELTRKYLVGTLHATSLLFNKIRKPLTLFTISLKQIPEIEIFKNQDPFKVYIKPNKMSGIDFAYHLYNNHSIEIESANDIGFLISIGMNFNEEIKDKLINAINEISCCRDVARNVPTEKSIIKPQINNLKLSPREAFMLGFQKNKNIEYECEINAPCPPGYALNVPGNEK
ncbi:MAG: PLP-dependent transferase [Candidatus Melainabacteria bacterium]|nr:PLP-dependent transferase [Candidatus Melainabacteria bacterium]